MNMKMNRFLSLLLALLIMGSMAIVSAWATESDGNESDFVAKIGAVGYRSLEEAAAAANPGDTIVLLADVTLEEALTLPAGIALDGNGKQISGKLIAGGDLTFVGHTKVSNFNAGYEKPVITIGAGACLEMNGSDRMVIGHGATFNITGAITDAKSANVADLTPSLIMPGASFTGAGVTFNVENAYIKTTASYCSSSKSASGTFDFNVTNSVWQQYSKLAFEAQSTAATVNFELKDSVLTTTSHLVFGVSAGEIVIDNSNVNVGAYRQLENRSNMIVKNGAVVYASVATSSNANNPGTLTVDNATYLATGELSGASLGTGKLIVKNGGAVTVGTISKTDVTVDGTAKLTAAKVITDSVRITIDASNMGKERKIIDLSNNGSIESIVTIHGAAIACFGEDGDITVTKAVAAVDGVYYSTFPEAVAVADGKTVTLLADVDLDSRIVLRGGVHITLEGAGKTITFQNTTYGFGVVESTLILGQGLNIVAEGNTCPLYVQNGTAITSANIKTVVNNGFSPVMINGSHSGVVTINGGRIVSENPEISAIYWPGEGTLTVNGGTIIGASAIYLKSGNLVITGGELIGSGEKQDYAYVLSGSLSTGAAVVLDNVGADGYEAIGSVSIRGGRFVSVNAAAVESYTAGIENVEKIVDFISGGTFSSDVSQWCAEGYYSPENADGTFGAKINPATCAHRYQTTVTPADCVTPGYTSYYCPICEDRYVGDPVPARGHALGKWVVVTQPTCSERGLRTNGCACGAMFYQWIPATERHEFGDWFVTKEATCTATGHETRKCACGATETRDTVLAAHTEAVDAAVAPTCTATGLTEGKHCSVCNEILKTQQKVDATGHMPVVDAAVAPTCATTGLSEGEHCCVCNEILKTQQKIDATGHTPVVDAAVAPTCTATGLTEGKRCSVCKAVLTVQSVIAALGHTEVTDAAIVPTCTEKGLTEGRHCSVCDAVLVAQYELSANGHHFGQWSTTKEATTKEAGQQIRSCACGATETREVPVMERDHTIVIVVAVVAGLSIAAALFFLKRK